jgi:signal transduction histidine kinase
MNNKFLQQLTITELIEGLCKDLQASSSLSIRCVIGEGNYNLTNEETIHLYRIVQELLTNGLKYVPSGEIKITLSDEAGKVFIFYEDKGPGFDAAIERKKGLGISNIEQRAKIIKGKAVLTTSVNKGTKWEINVPSNHSS